MAKQPSQPRGGKPKGFFLSRRAAAAWAAAVFILCGWMFGMGVMVGRDTAPIRFDLDRLQNSLESLKKQEAGGKPGLSSADPAQMKEKTHLDFYEVLPKSRDDADMPKLPKPPPAAGVRAEPPAAKAKEPPAAAKAEKPAAAPAPPPAPAAAAPGQSYTVQVTAVKSEDEARRTVDRLRQRGYAAHVEAVAIPDKGTWYRVRMGEFPSREFARSTLERLQKDGFKPMVVPK
jgi:cell division septation protein DedD